MLLGAWPAIAAEPLQSRAIAEARQQSDSFVTVTGVVTVPSARFESATFDRGFAVQDETGGLYIHTDRDWGLHQGDRVTVTGFITDDGHGQQVLDLQRVDLRDHTTATVSPQRVSIHDAIARLKGSLVTVEGEIQRAVVDDAPYGDRLWIRDDTGTVQVYIPRSTNINPAAWPDLQPGQWLTVTGFSGEYDGRDEVIPRDRKDIVIARSP